MASSTQARGIEGEQYGNRTRECTPGQDADTRRPQTGANIRCCRPHQLGRAPLPETALALPMSAPANAELHFLVVDALAGVQTFARQLLEGFGFPAHSIRCASDTDTALALGLEFKPDFLITDWFAKASLNGIALYQRLKDQNPGCRLALLSFEVTPAHEAEAHAAGSRFLLRKPFTADELRNTMQRSLETLAKERPELAQRLNAVIKAQQGPGKLPVKLALPPLPPQLRAGDRVQYGTSTDTVQFVVVRSGELVVQLKGKPELVPAHKLQRL